MTNTERIYLFRFSKVQRKKINRWLIFREKKCAKKDFSLKSSILLLRYKFLVYICLICDQPKIQRNSFENAVNFHIHTQTNSPQTNSTSLSIPLDFQLNTINSCQNGSDEISHTLITRVGSNHVILINMNHLYIAINVQRRHARRTLSLSSPQLYRVVLRMVSFRARHISTTRLGSIEN